jgi:CRP/FNR family transcriptional regulator
MENLARSGIVHAYIRHPKRVQVACSRCRLGDLCMPRGLSAEEVERFRQIVHRSNPIQSGEHLFRSGDTFSSVVFVRNGCFKSYVVDYNGQEHVLGFHLPGGVVGFDAIHSRLHSANVVALKTSAVCYLPFESLSGMALLMPELQSELLRIMSQRIGELHIISADLSANERIAVFLISLSDRFASRGHSNHEFTLAMTRREVASYLRMATETVSRVLARFQTAGLLQVDRKRVIILKLEKLRELSRNGAASENTDYFAAA